MTNTDANIGTRKMIYTLAVPAYRNFEPSGTVLYNCNHSGLNFMGTGYAVGAALPFDVGGTSYSNAAMAQLQLFWDQEWIVPAS